MINRKLDADTLRHIVKQRSRILGHICRKMDTDQGRAYQSPLLRLRKKYVISMEQLSKETGIHVIILRKIEADEPRMVVKSGTLIKLADFFELKYWKNLVTGDR